MTPAWNILEDILKNHKPIDEQFQSAEQELEVMIYDYVDLNVPVLARMYDRRLKGYRSIGYEIGDD